MSYHELKERLEKLQDTDFGENIYERYEKLADLADDLLFELGRLEHLRYLFKRDVPPEVSSFYPRITKDPTIEWYNRFDGREGGSKVVENPNFVKLHELGLYSLTNCSYCIRGEKQIKYLAESLDFDFNNYTYYINFD